MKRVMVEVKLLINKKTEEKIGGSVWESNPPCPLVVGNTGFEVREGHQNLRHSHA